MIVGVLYAALAVAIFPQDYAALVVRTFITFEPAGLLGTLITVCVLGIVRSPASPLGYARRYFIGRLPLLVVSNLMFVACLTAYTTFKINIPSIVPFYLDSWLADFDHWLYGGDPWSAFLLPHQDILPHVNRLYSQIWGVVLVGGYVVATVVLRGERLRRYLWAMLGVYMLLGNLLATCLSSVGPIFYGDFYAPDRFAAAKAAMFENTDAGNIVLYARYLLSNYQLQTPAFGTGISAMPSVHVACAVLIAWMLTGVGPLLSIVGWSYAVLIYLSSIYTGWHYSLDGYVSAVLVSAIWIALSRYYQLPILWMRRSASGTGV